MPNLWMIVYVKILKLVYILMMNAVNIGKTAVQNYNFKNNLMYLKPITFHAVLILTYLIALLF